MRRSATGRPVRNELAVLAHLAIPTDTRAPSIAELRPVFDVNEATLYRILHRFHALGWVNCWWDVPADPWSQERPIRRFYLTDDGLDAADRWTDPPTT